MITTAQWAIKFGGAQDGPPSMRFLQLSLSAFAFGLLIEWKRLRNVFLNKVQVNYWLFIPTILLTIVSFTPNIYWFPMFGLMDNPFYIDILTLPETNRVLLVLSGILLLRSISPEN